METKFPSAEAYSNEPIRHAPLELVDVEAEQHAVTADYCNMVLNRVNFSCLRLTVFHGDYRWHHHPTSDELFLVVAGLLEIDLADGHKLALGPWQAVVIPAGTVHRTRAVRRTVNLTFEALAAETVFVD
jgi:mannose-6-phosphate isomerase-like protein (cupin superfamily)